MSTKRPKNIKTKTIVLVVLFYTLLTNLEDVRDGFLKGWNSINIGKIK
jgi:hypothetical protein